MEDDNNTASKLINDEIKEILDKCKRQIKNDLDYRISPYQLKQLLDYITYLQQKEELFEKIVYKYDELKQENERIKKMNMHEHKYGSDMEEKYLIEKQENENNIKMLNDIIKEQDGKLNDLQQRIEYLERSNNRREDTIMGLRDEIVEYEDYKSRIEKAENQMQLIRDLGFDYDGFNDVENLKLLIDELVRIADKSIDILNGRSDE